MPTTEAGDPTNFPTAITIPSDGDGPGIKALDVNAGFEGLADRTAWLKANSSNVDVANAVTITATGTTTTVAPTNAIGAILEGFGSGAGGGGGVTATATNRQNCGGGGGGGAIAHALIVPIVGGASLRHGDPRRWHGRDGRQQREPGWQHDVHQGRGQRGSRDVQRRNERPARTIAVDRHAVTRASSPLVAGPAPTAKRRARCSPTTTAAAASGRTEQVP